ncbi:hypothetical protein [Streptomyces roseolilacinus]|uniref:Uncharacterized protein n=1 Tax=Streptomyces roseolilacinus TaxID=66904 RepID=A0A918EKR1_9ACTN|nr:hypothetical protein [Streptomyces roseolilacinus]GGQ00125.1 hypothetical protein GCM10010249_17940 [Streptomyces roseolilacinus]
MSPHDRLVDQIVFRWDTDNLSGTTGFGPVAWSCAPELADAVFRRTAPLLRATGQATAPALLRLESADQVLLVHRAPWRDPGGRAGAVCHALMGPAAVLDPATCLGLHPWSWEGGDLPLAEVRGGLPPVPEAALLPAADAGQRLLAGGLAGVRRELVGAVAEFLRHPKAGFTLLDPSGQAAHRVLWGLHGIFGGQVTRRWTFATHDTAESDGLRFVFVSRWTGEASGSGTRRRTDPVERCGDRAESAAERLVRHQLREEYEVGTALQRAADHHRATRGGPTTLLALAEAALSGLPPLDEPSRRPAAAPPRKAPAAGHRQSPPVPVVASEWPVPSEDRPRVRRWLGGGSPQRRGPADDELLRDLRACTGYERLTHLITEAADRWPSWDREQRAALCKVLLERELFVTDRAGVRAADDVRAANAASLYRWAVRPLLDDPALSARVTELLPRLSAGPHRAARAAVRQITQSRAPGLPEPAWQALLAAALASHPGPEGAPGPVGERGGTPAARPPGTRPGRWEDDDAPQPRPGRRPGTGGPRAAAEDPWDASGGRAEGGGSSGSAPRGGGAGSVGGERGWEGAVPPRGGGDRSWDGPSGRSGGRADGGGPSGSASGGGVGRSWDGSVDGPDGRVDADRPLGSAPRGDADREWDPPAGGPGGPPDAAPRGGAPRSAGAHRGWGGDGPPAERPGRPVPHGDAAPPARPGGEDRYPRREADGGTSGADPRGGVDRAREDRPRDGGPGRAPDPSGGGAAGGSPRDRGAEPPDGWRSRDAAARGEAGRVARADGDGRAPGGPRPVRDDRSREGRGPRYPDGTGGPPDTGPHPGGPARPAGGDHRDTGGDHRPAGSGHRDTEGDHRDTGAGRRGTEGTGGGTGARTGPAGGERAAEGRDPGRFAGDGGLREGAGPGGPGPERRPVVGGRGAGEAPYGHRAEPGAPPAPPPPAHPPRPTGEGRTGDGGAEPSPADRRPADRHPADRRPPDAGPAARGGTDPPGGADKRPFVVVGVGTGAILVLLGVILVLMLRACA